MMTKVLIADDEVNIANPIKYVLEREGFEAEAVYNGNDALQLILNETYDIIILDVMMPIYNGYDICKSISDRDIGIIMLTAKNSTTDKVIGLELGADDYITKPFDMTELIARVRSLDRRLNKSKVSNLHELDNVLVYDSLKIDEKERAVLIDDIYIELKPKEFELLLFLAQNNRKTFTRDHILDAVWGVDYYGGSRTVDIHIQRIRKKLVEYSKLIKTVPKVGYKFVGESN